MAAIATFKYGDPCMVDHVPAADVAVGDVLVVGDTIRVAHRAIKAGEKGAVAACCGVYQVPKATTGGSAIGDAKRVYWDAVNKVITTTAGTNKIFGYTVGASVDADATQYVLQQPA